MGSILELDTFFNKLIWYNLLGSAQKWSDSAQNLVRLGTVRTDQNLSFWSELVGIWSKNLAQLLPFGTIKILSRFWSVLTSSDQFWSVLVGQWKDLLAREPSVFVGGAPLICTRPRLSHVSVLFSSVFFPCTLRNNTFCHPFASPRAKRGNALVLK